jgi:DNA modification methylase
MSAYYEDSLLTLHHGHAADVARTLAPRSVQTIVTSPPYFGLRDYGEDGQIGAEQSVEEYVDALVAVFASLRDVLADDGTLWVNLGDSYVSSPPGNKGFQSSGLNGAKTSEKYQETLRSGTQTKRDTTRMGLAAKNLIGVPWRVALALQSDGWVLRSDIIWSKPTPMPESVTDRPTKAHEYVFLLAKGPRYYYDAEAISEPIVKGNAGSGYLTGKTSVNQEGRASKKERVERDTRNKRTVWTVASVPFPGAHFATYPPDLIRPCILAGSRVGDTVLDPFSGSGTTGQVALQHGRKYVGIDISREYLDLSLRARFQEAPLDFGGVA